MRRLYLVHELLLQTLECMGLVPPEFYDAVFCDRFFGALARALVRCFENHPQWSDSFRKLPYATRYPCDAVDVFHQFIPVRGISASSRPWDLDKPSFFGTISGADTHSDFFAGLANPNLTSWLE